MNLKSLALSVAACTQQGKYFAPHLASSLVHQTRGAIATYSGRIWKHLETVRGVSLNRTGGARAFYIHILPNKATVQCTKAWHLHIHICGGGCQSRRTECQIIGRLSKGIQRYAPGVSQGIFQRVKGFRIKLTALDSFLIQFYLLLLPRVVERMWSCLFLFYLAAVMHGARLVSKGVEKVRRQLEVADGGFQTDSSLNLLRFFLFQLPLLFVSKIRRDRNGERENKGEGKTSKLKFKVLKRELGQN